MSGEPGPESAREGRFQASALIRAIRQPAASAVMWMMLSAVLGRVAALLMTVVIGRRIGPESYGVFAFATSTVLLAAQLGGLGWPMLVIRMIPKYVQEQDWSRLRGLRKSADRVMLAATLAIGLGFAVFAGLFLDRRDPLFVGMLVAAALIVPTGFRLLHRQELAGIDRAAPGIFFDETMAPLFVLVACLVLGMRQDTEIFAVYVAGTYASAVFSRVLNRRWAHRGEFTAKPTFEFRAWMTVSLPMMTAVASRVMLDRVDSIMLAPLSSVYQVGLYGSAFRIVVATNVVIMISAIVRPMLARLYEAGEHRRAARVMRNYYLFTGVTAVGMGAALFFLADPIIRLSLGPEFIEAAGVMRILAVGQVFGALAEASSSYLLMCGKERLYGAFSLIGLLMNVLLNFMLIPTMGAEGTALATAFTNLVFFGVSCTIVARALKERSRAEERQSPS
jgi:O-antigen/teichoic acid export membrane protein